MRPAAAVMIGFGVLLVAGLVWASFFIPVRIERYRVTKSAETSVAFNVWGRPLTATTWRTVPALGKPEREEIDKGPYYTYTRQGKWVRMTRIIGSKEWVPSFHWYIDGHEVSEEDWRAGRKPQPEPPH